MNRFFTKTFVRFFFGFLAIIILALAILIAAGYAVRQQQSGTLVDNTTAVQ